MRRRLSTKFIVINALVSISIFLSAPRLQAQAAGTGTIQGTIRDSRGGAVPGAKVEALDVATGRRSSQLTGSAGSYSITALQPGSYTVVVSAKGFTQTTQDGIVVNAVTVVGLDLTLHVGAVAETVQVTAAPPDIDTENGSLGTTMPNSTYTSLPLALSGSPKNPLGFLTLMPGTAMGDENVVNINGGPSDTSYLYLNGLPLTTSELQGDARTVQGSTSTEVVDSFQVISSGVPAYYQGQGITNLVSKSGTNQVHGDVYENFRNTFLDAGGFTPLPGSAKPPEHQNEYGGSIGGHILRDRLFYFGNIDRFKYTYQNPQVSYSLPTAAERAGDFSASGVNIYDPATTTCVDGVCTRQQFVSNGVANVIPPDRLSAIAQQLQSYLPATQNDALQNNYQSAFLDGNTQNSYMGKIDIAINDKQHAFGLVQYGKSDTLGLPNLGGPQLPLPYSSTRTTDVSYWVAELGHTWTLTPRLTNIFGVEFNRFASYSDDPTNNGNYGAASGLKNLPAGLAQNDFPSIEFTGSQSPTEWANSAYTQNVNQIGNTYIFQDNLTLVKGRHTVTAGGQVSLQEEDTTTFNYVSGLNFSSNETSNFIASNGSSSPDPTNGNGYASFLVGAVDNASVYSTTLADTGARYREYSVYAQDDWKLTPKLELNLGLRYTIPKPYVEVLDRYSFFNPTLPNPAVDGYPGALQFAGNGPDSCHCDTNVKTHYLSFDPRIGFAYAFSRNTVLRGAYGINHYNGGELGGNGVSQGPGQIGYAASPSFDTPDGGETPAFYLANGIPAYAQPPQFSSTLNSGFNTTTGPNGGSLPYNRPATAGRMPYSENYNLTVDQALNRTLSLELSYSGSESHFLATNGGAGIYTNQILPQYEALGSLLTTTLTPTSLAQAQAIFPQIKIPYANFSGSIGQALRPFPQYSTLGDQFGDFGADGYNSLQVRLQNHENHGLYFLASYTFSKTMNDANGTVGFIYTAPRTAYDLHREWSLSSTDVTHAFSGSVVYKLPFGRGHRFGNSRAMDLLVGGFSFSGIFQYTSGVPVGPILASCTVPYAGDCFADYGTTRVARINGSYGSERVQNRNAVYLNRAAFATPAPFTFGNTARTAPDGLRLPTNADEDITIGKDFRITDRLTWRVQGDAFNVLNRVIPGGLDTNLSDSTFGQIPGQANSPRRLQLETYFKF